MIKAVNSQPDQQVNCFFSINVVCPSGVKPIERVWKGEGKPGKVIGQTILKQANQDLLLPVYPVAAAQGFLLVRGVTLATNH